MTNFKILVGAALALVMSPLAAGAQPSDPQAPAMRRAPAAGAGLTLQDFVARNERRFMAADTDGDGKISRAEFLAAAKAGRADPAKRFAKLDRNADGLLDKAEIDAMLTKRFQHLDANGDGILSADERSAAHARNPGGAGNGSAP